jgi:hypothetical protein
MAINSIILYKLIVIINCIKNGWKITSITKNKISVKINRQKLNGGDLSINKFNKIAFNI